jgi:hypothetical protein
MVPYQMNMARGHLLPLETRKRWLRWLAVYFLIVLVALGVSVGSLTRTGIAIFNQQDRVRAMERQFLDDRPGVVSVGAHRQRLGQEMAVYESQLGAIASFRKGECHAAGVLLGLMNVMPDGLDLGNLSLDGTATRMECEVYLASGLKMGDSMTPPRLISLWSSEPLLAGRINHYTSEKSERVVIDGQEVMSWRFSGVLSGGK